MKKFVFYTLFLFIVPISLFDCGVALTPKATVKIPPDTETEIFKSESSTTVLKIGCPL